MLEQPEKTELNNILIEYAHFVIEKAWPAQQQGIVPKAGTLIINKF